MPIQMRLIIQSSNDDAIRAVKLICSVIANAVNDEKKLKPIKKQETPQEEKVESASTEDEKNQKTKLKILNLNQKKKLSKKNLLKKKP